jgi:hypothetical protein
MDRPMDKIHDARSQTHAPRDQRKTRALVSGCMRFPLSSKIMVFGAVHQGDDVTTMSPCDLN